MNWKQSITHSIKQSSETLHLTIFTNCVVRGMFTLTSFIDEFQMLNGVSFSHIQTNLNRMFYSVHIYMQVLKLAIQKRHFLKILIYFVDEYIFKQVYLYRANDMTLYLKIVNDNVFHMKVHAHAMNPLHIFFKIFKSSK